MEENNPAAHYAILDGGPRDGTVACIGDTITEYYRTFGTAPLSTPRQGQAMVGNQLTRAAVYRLVRREVDQEPSRDDRGYLRYRYQCQEAA